MNLDYIKNYTNSELVKSFAFKRQISISESYQIFEDVKSFLSLHGYIKIYSKKDPLDTPKQIEIDSDTYIIDEMWHSFILRTKDYALFCNEAFGKFIDHSPVPISEMKEKTLWSEEEVMEYRLKLNKQLKFIVKVLGVNTLSRWYKEYPQKYKDPMLDIVRTSSDWLGYYEQKRSLGVRDTTVKGVQELKKNFTSKDKVQAIDLGSGDGSDILELLKVSSNVIAIDSSENSKKLINDKYQENVDFKLIDFNNVKLQKSHILNASYSLPFCKRENFFSLWKEIESSILKGGIFCGHFFGQNSINLNNNILTLLDKSTVTSLFNQFEIIQMEDCMRPYFHNGKYVGDRHIYNVVARKL